MKEVLLLRWELQQDILKACRLLPEILLEKDGSITVALNEIDISVNGSAMDDFIEN